MIVFITSLRHPCNSHSYTKVLALLEQTLASVCNQTAGGFRVVVVGNVPPPRDFPAPPAVSFVEVDFPPPVALPHAHTGIDALRLDRGCKYTVGLLHAARWAPEFVMFFDADDFVNSGIAEFAAASPGSNGWYIPEGYLYDGKLDRLGLLSEFDRVCGTSHIVRYELFELPQGIDESSTQGQILDRLDREYLLHFLGGHRWTRSHLVERGTPLEPLPFAGALYYVGNRQNHTPDTETEALWKRRSRVTVLEPSRLGQIREEFGLPPRSALVGRD